MKKIAIICSIFYKDQTKEIIEKTNRIPMDFDLHIAMSNSSDYDYVRKNSNAKKIITYKYQDYGMDIGNFFYILNKIKDKKYDYFLKIHSKKEELWRTSMLSATLPIGETQYKKLFKNIDKYNVSGSQTYLQRFHKTHQNKDLILKKIKQFNLKIKEEEIWDTLKAFDPTKEKLDEEFYLKYNEDLRLQTLKQRNQGVNFNDFAKDHWEKHGHKEKGRVPNPDLIKSKAKKDYKFYAGTIFWFNKKYKNFLLKNTDEYSVLNKNLQEERKVVKNVETTYTHHLEHWFGILASYLADPLELKGMTTIACKLPPFVEIQPRSGGLRTALRLINALDTKNTFLHIEMCGLVDLSRAQPSKNELQKILTDQINKISQYKELSNIKDLTFFLDFFDLQPELSIATGWQTFAKSTYYSDKNKKTAFLCQDLEYEFDIVKNNPVLKKISEDFYKSTIPTFTMSSYLKHQFKDGRKITHANLNVNKETFFNKRKKRSGICLLYDSSKSHRLPFLIVTLANFLREKYPQKNIYLYGDPVLKNFQSEFDNIKLLGALTIEQTADLYNKTELGVVFSTTNPSRIAFEMVACGTPAIEADCEYTKYDMNSPAFVRVKPERDAILNKIHSILSNPKEMQRLQRECEIYSDEYFIKQEEERRFSKFINETVMEGNL